MPNAPQGGKAGQQLGDIHDVFRKRLKELQLQAQQAQNAFQGQTQREWQVPTELQSSLLDIANLHVPAFDRTPINDNYENVVKDPSKPGTVGDVIGLQLQIDYNACEERAFRARSTSICRAMCLGHARRFGQGHGNLWNDKTGIEAGVNGFIAAGGVAPPGGASS